MAQARVHISLFNLIVEIEADFQYPDMVQDMTNRVMASFISTLEYCKTNNLDIRSTDFDLEDEE